MKFVNLFISLILTLFLLIGCDYQQKAEEILGQVLASNGGNVPITEEEIAEALKEALELGIKEAVKSLGVTNGFYQNEKFKIKLPEGNEELVELFMKAGGEEKVKNFVISMNRSAEKAVPDTLEIFIKAITDMTVSDAKTILLGNKNSATLYFKDKTQVKIITLITPIVKQAMKDADVEKTYQVLYDIYTQLDSLLTSNDTVNAIFSFVTKVSNIEKPEMLTYDEVIEHVLTNTLKALFTLIEEKEAKIRDDVEQRTTDLLKRVFELYDEEKSKK